MEKKEVDKILFSIMEKNNNILQLIQLPIKKIWDQQWNAF